MLLLEVTTISAATAAIKYGHCCQMLLLLTALAAVEHNFFILLFLLLLKCGPSWSSGVHSQGHDVSWSPNTENILWPCKLFFKGSHLLVCFISFLMMADSESFSGARLSLSSTVRLFHLLNYGVMSFSDSFACSHYVKSNGRCCYKNWMPSN